MAHGDADAEGWRLPGTNAPQDLTVFKKLAPIAYRV